MPSTAIGAAISTFFTSEAVGYVIARYVVFQVVVTAVSRRFTGKGRTRTEQDPLASQQITSREPTQPRDMVYGSPVKAGQLVFMDTPDTNKFSLWMVIAFAAHEIEDFEELYLDGRTVDISTGTTELDANGLTTGTDFKNINDVQLLRVKRYYGTITQTADSHMTAAFSTSSKWTSNHRLRGIAYLAMELIFDDTNFGTDQDDTKNVWPDGVPQSIRVRIKGKKVYDPRGPITAYTANSALCAADYLTDTDIGMARDYSDIDETLLISAADTCDESVTIWAGNGDDTTTSTMSRYECHGALSTDQNPSAILEEILETMGGGTITESAGAIEIYPGRYDAPALTFTEDDFAGAIRYAAKPQKRERWNFVRGQFIDDARNAKPAEFSPRTDAAYETADGARLTRDLRLALVKNEQRAQWLAMLLLKQSRLAGSVEFTFKFGKALGVKRHDVIRVSHDEMGWTNELFRVTDFELVPSDDFGMVIVMRCRREETDAYDVDYATELEDINPAGFDLSISEAQPSPISEMAVDGVRNGIRIEFQPPGQAGVRRYEVWRSDDNDRDNAQLRAQLSPQFDNYDDLYDNFRSTPPTLMETGDTFYYWMRVMGDNGLPSTWFPVSATGGLSGSVIGTAVIVDEEIFGASNLTTSYVTYVDIDLDLTTDDSNVQATGSFDMISVSPPDGGGPDAPSQNIEFRVIRDPGGANEKVIKTSSYFLETLQSANNVSTGGTDIRTADTNTSYIYALQVRKTASIGNVEIRRRSLTLTQIT